MKQLRTQISQNRKKKGLERIRMKIFTLDDEIKCEKNLYSDFLFFLFSRKNFPF